MPCVLVEMMGEEEEEVVVVVQWTML